MNLLRRKFLKTAAFVGVAVTVGSGMLVPQRALGAYAKTAFEAKDVGAALSAAMGSDQHSDSGDIVLEAPEIAENGTVVPVKVSASMGGVDAISIFVTGNDLPLTSTYALSAASEPFISTRIKMRETSDVVAVVKADGKLYSTTRKVRVTIGGCGG